LPTAIAERHDAMQHLAQVLQFDAEQQRAVAAILNRRQTEVDAAWHAMQPHVRATLDSASAEIIAVLRPDQAAAYRKMIVPHSTQHHR
jgi:hypothetical protein